jgi:ABC-2 type transport system permease protein
MMYDVLTVLWKEWRELIRIGGGRRGALVRAFLSVGLLGVIWPWLIGPPFVDSGLPLLFASATAAMYVAALIPDSFPGERERHTLDTLLASRLPDTAILLGKITSVVLYGYSASLAMLVTGWVTVNLKDDGPMIFYRRSVLLAAVVFALLAAGLMAGVGVIIALRSATVKQAQQVLTTGVMFLLLAPALLAEAWPGGFNALVSQFSGERRTDSSMALIAAATLVIAQLILFVIAKRMFRRTKLLVERPD